ncbi:hypothetical protein [Pseudomonas fragi]|uniref:hypothetical protein n=1 Tax=Pseudomonas fragi TaxID=296 RepID=UPI0021CCA3C1|nr:hypothetical protein [Pseudomonas fragi]
MSSVQAVIFDAFGTVLQIKNARHPFRQLLKLGLAQGRRPKPDDAAVLMTNQLTLGDAATHFGIVASSSELARIQAELESEISSIEPFLDAMASIQTLKLHKIKVAI